MTFIPLNFNEFKPLIKRFDNFPTHHFRDKESYLLYKPTNFGVYVCRVDLSEVDEGKFKLEFLGNSVELSDKIKTSTIQVNVGE